MYLSPDVSKIIAAEIGRQAAYKVEEPGDTVLFIPSSGPDPAAAHRDHIEARHLEWEAEQAAEAAKVEAAVRARRARIQAAQPSRASLFWKAADDARARGVSAWNNAVLTGDLYRHAVVNVPVCGSIGCGSMERAAARILQRPNARVAVLTINSLGGDYSAALFLTAVIAKFKEHGGRVQARVVGRCGSAALSIYATAEHRSARENATFWAHRTVDAGDQLEEAMLLAAGVDGQQFHALRDRDELFGWETAVGMGLVNCDTRLPRIRQEEPAPAKPKRAELDPEVRAWAEELAAASDLDVVDVENMLRDGKIR